MKLYAKQNQNIEFIHEPYYQDKIGKVLENLTAYKKSDEYQQTQLAKEKAQIAKKQAEDNKKLLYFFTFIVFIAGLVYLKENFLLAFGWVILWGVGFFIWVSTKTALY